MKRFLLLFGMLLLVATISACVPDGPPNPGFRLHTIEVEFDIFGFPYSTIQDGITVTGNMVPLSWDRGATGDLQAFFLNSGNNGYVDVDGGRAPASWTFGETNGSCAGKSTTNRIPAPGVDWDLKCLPVELIPFFTVSPQVIDVNAPPASIVINGSGISSAGGMPMVEYYNLYGTLVAQAAASQVAYDGTWLSGPTPDLAAVCSGRYLLTVRNSDGRIAGNAVVDVIDYIAPPPDPGDGGSGDGCPALMICQIN